MAFVFPIWAGLLFSLACNLDTLLLALCYRIKGVEVTPVPSVLVAFVTTVVTYLSLVLGAVASLSLGDSGTTLGGLVLVGMGLWFLLDWLRGHQEEENPVAPKRLWGWVSLAAALAVNNGGMGVAAGMGGLPPLTCALCNFSVTLLSLPLGRWLGGKIHGTWLSQGVLPLSGVLLLILGVGQVVS